MSKIDEDRFHSLEFVLDRIACDLDKREAKLVELGYSAEEARQYAERLKKGVDFITNFGPTQLSTQIANLTLTTSNLELKRLADRLEREVDPWMESVPLVLPDGTTKLCDVHWDCACLIGTSARASVYEVARKRYPDRDVKVMDHVLPPNSALTLEMPDGTCHIIFPLAEIESTIPPTPPPYPSDDEDEEQKLYLIYVIDKQEFWITYPFQPRDPKPQVAIFPGTDLRISIGKLSGFFTDHITLEVLDDVEKFSVRDAGRFEGKIHALRGDKAVEVT